MRELIQEFPHIQFLFVDGRKECTRIVKCACENNSIEPDTMLALQYHAALLSDSMLNDYEKNRFSTWGARVSPEAMSLAGFE